MESLIVMNVKQGSLETTHDLVKRFEGMVTGRGVSIVVKCKNPSTSDVEKLLKKAGNKIGSVHFHKRETGELRKMCYKLGVASPKYASAPKGSSNRKDVNKKNTQLTVFDVNKVLRDHDGRIIRNDKGKMQRGSWRTVPLEKVVRICVEGVVYEIERSGKQNLSADKQVSLKKVKRMPYVEWDAFIPIK
jgi:hypothetical protein